LKAPTLEAEEAKNMRRFMGGSWETMRMKMTPGNAPPPRRFLAITPAIQLELTKIREQLYHPSPPAIPKPEVILEKAA